LGSDRQNPDAKASIRAHAITALDFPERFRLKDAAAVMEAGLRWLAAHTPSAAKGARR